MAIKKSNCELCGRKEERLAYSHIEGVKMQVCSNCVKFGKVIGEVKIPNKHEEQREKTRSEKGMFVQDELEEVVVPNYPELIRGKREKLGLSQKVFASKLNEKESFVIAIENGKMPLSIEMARKLGKLLGLDLIVKEKVVHLAKGEGEGEGEEGEGPKGALTIGDILLNKLGK